VSIDKADHLLMNSADSAYVGNVISGWAERYLVIPKKEILKTSHQVAVNIGNEDFTRLLRFF
jgi:putative redox protein